MSDGAVVSPLKDRAQVVIIGAGIVGCSVAYHLTRMGVRDVVVVEQGPLFETGGSTSHAPGMMFLVNFSETMSRLAQYSADLYSSLSLHGEPCGYKVGGMEVAWTPERLEDLKRKTGAGKAWGLQAELLGPSEAKQMAPLLSDKVLGAMYSPYDSVTRQVWAAEAMANAAMAEGAAFHGDTLVEDVEVSGGRVRAVVTSNGTVRTDIVVSAAGIWAPRIGRMAGMAIPLSPMRHQYAHTIPIPELEGETGEFEHPILRHQDRAMYFRQRMDHFVVGSYRHEPLLVEADDILDREDAPVMPSMMAWEPGIFENALESAGELLPCLRGVALDSKVNGMFSFTTDGMPLLGESPSVRGFWSAQAVWITHAGGVGKAVAEWIVEGEPSMDMRECDISRFHPHAYSRRYVQTRSAQQFREVYDIVHPEQQMETPRNLRVSPFYSREKELGAVFFESGGWERPQWYAANEGLLRDERKDWASRSGWAARHRSPIIGAEHRAARERVVLFDSTPFTKLEVAGTGALSFIQGITANDMDRPRGTVTYTAMLTPSGGIKCDLTVVRLEADRFLIVTGGGLGMHDQAWIRGHIPADGTVRIADVTGALCCVSVWGPKARDLMQAVSEDDFSNDVFQYLDVRQVTVGEVPLLAARISYVGELGWELFTPVENGVRVWDTLWDAGQPLGVAAMGLGALDSLRLEKGYRLWGSDIHTGYNPYEAGLGFSVKLGKGDFVGGQALERVKAASLTRKLCCMTFDDPTALAMGNEPVFHGERVLGHVTSANYGYTVGESICYGYLPVEYAKVGTAVEVEYFGERQVATVVREPLYDPSGIKMKS